MERRKMNEKTEELKRLLEVFSVNANWDMLHPLDWQRFYDVIIFVFNEGLRDFTDTDLRRFFEAKGISDEIIEELQTVYNHGLDILRYYR